MVDATVFVVSLVATILALIWGFVYFRSRSHSDTSMHRKDDSVEQSATKNDQPESTNDVSKSSSGASIPERWPIEECLKSCALGSSKKLEDDTAKLDPLDYCGHIQREMKRTKQRLAMEKIEAEMTEEQKEEERRAQRQQIEEIFRLMQNNKDEFGLASVDEIQEQMKLYINT